jgi:hypothetical protein
MFWDRRKADRRAGGKKHDTERRAGDGDEKNRRRWTCGILYKTSVPVQDIEQWLTDNTKGRWAVGQEGNDEGLSSKVLKIMFETQEDKAAFIAVFSGR